MTVPTALQLKTEITTGPLAAGLADAWGNVFPTEVDPSLSPFHPVQQRYERIKDRFGRLTPDGAFDILKVLNNETLRSKAFPISMATFTKWLAVKGLLRKIKNAPTDPTVLNATVKDVCDLVGTMVLSAPDRLIDPLETETTTMINVLVAGGIVTSEQKAEFLTYCTKPCSRLSELGWTGVDYELLTQAKAL
jgi:hypothetical protein